MAKRTPRNQARSQFHSYWGEFAYSTASPAPSTFLGLALSTGGMELPNAPFWTGGDATDLERGDIAFVYDAQGSTGSLYAPWVCLDAGTLGGLDAIWDRIAPIDEDITVPLVATQTGTTESLVGSIYLRANTVLKLDSRALLGGSIITHGAILRMRSFSGGALIAYFEVLASTLADTTILDPGGSNVDVLVSTAGWYDLYLAAPSAPETAVVRGLHLHTLHL